MKFSISFKYSNVTFKNKETKETIAYDTKASEGNTFTFDNVDEDVVIGIVKGIKNKKAADVFAFDNFRTNFINVLARNKCKELYDKLDKGGWKIEDVSISNITIKDLEFTKPTMNARETITVESKKMKKLNITKEQFNRSNYFQRKYGKLEYVSESGRLFKTSKGKVLKFTESYEDEYDDENMGDGQWHVFDYGPDFPLVEQYMIMSPTGDTWPSTSRGAICDYDGEYSYSTRQEMENDVFALEVDGEEWTPTEIDQPYPREVLKAIRLVISRLEEEGITVDEP